MSLSLMAQDAEVNASKANYNKKVKKSLSKNFNQAINYLIPNV